MYRPFLSSLFHTNRTVPGADHNTMDTAMRHSMLAKGVSLCTSTAQDLVDLIVRYLEAASNLLPPPWYNVYCKAHLVPSLHLQHR